jgi:ATP-dependent RNA helicase DDX31/DBP7
MVLDEGDRLVDMGFLESVGKILRIVEGRVQHRIMKERKEGVVQTDTAAVEGGMKLPSRLVKVLCSATLRAEEGLGALETIVDPVFIKGEGLDLTEDGSLTLDDGVEKMFTPGQLTQKTIILPAKLRLVTLLALLSSFANNNNNNNNNTKDTTSKMIIFLSCSTSVSFHHQLLSSYPTLTTNLNLFLLHGTLDQPTRTTTLKTFSAQKGKSVLLATDVASRGLDLNHLDQIIQFDPPASMDDYIHRIGRTARAGRTGEGMLVLLPSEEGYVDKLRGLGMDVQGVKYEDVLRTAWGKEWMNHATEMQLLAEKWVLQDQDVQTPLPDIHFQFPLLRLFHPPISSVFLVC